MSVIYSKLTSVINKISDEFHKSFLFTTIFSILSFIENQWVNSYFKKLYPDEDFLNFLNKSNILKNHLFNPLIVIVLFSFFLILSMNNPSCSTGDKSRMVHIRHSQTLLLSYGGYLFCPSQIYSLSHDTCFRTL